MWKIVNFFKRRRIGAGLTAEADKLVGRSWDEIYAEIEPHLKPALSLQKTESEVDSYLGGDPHLPGDHEWPERSNKPLSFLACLDLAEIATTATIDWLPAQGKLLIFYDMEEQPWGFDPKDRDGWSVLHIEQQSREPTRESVELPKHPVCFKPFRSLPGWERLPKLGVTLTDDEFDTYDEGVYNQNTEHQIGGYPLPVQNDYMEEEAQLASHGLYLGDAYAYSSKEGKELLPGAKDWRLLLQIATDDELGVMWGDVGSLYFWVQEERAKQGDFSNVWLVLQCH